MKALLGLGYAAIRDEVHVKKHTGLEEPRLSVDSSSARFVKGTALAVPMCRQVESGFSR